MALSLNPLLFTLFSICWAVWLPVSVSSRISRTDFPVIPSKLVDVRKCKMLSDGILYCFPLWLCVYTYQIAFSLPHAPALSTHTDTLSDGRIQSRSLLPAPTIHT